VDIHPQIASKSERFIFFVVVVAVVVVLLGGIPTPVKNMSSSVGKDYPNIWEHKIPWFQSPPSLENALIFLNQGLLIGALT
jgi:hypothetical protein